MRPFPKSVPILCPSLLITPVVASAARAGSRVPKEVSAIRTLFAILLAVSAAQLSAQNDAPIAPASAQDLNRLSIEELMQQEVISVSRIPQQLARVPSAMVVVGGDDIRAAGATRLAETLRLAPNLQVAQVDARQWAITARGSNSTTANKLLVMIDGRTVYTPLFAGVFWDSQDTYVPDIDRIEVVSGPAGTSWGTNAVNGVINVVTKRAQDTQGLHVYGGAGTETLWTGGLRYGGRAGQNGYYRVYAKGAEYDDALSSTGSSGNDARSSIRSRYRATCIEVAACLRPVDPSAPRAATRS
jgi:iron complex outermembrane receptor protein